MAEITKEAVVDYLSNLPVIQIAELVKELAGWNPPGSLRFQYSFLSNRGRAVTPTARGDCECGRISRRAA